MRAPWASSLASMSTHDPVYTIEGSHPPSGDSCKAVCPYNPCLILSILCQSQLLTVWVRLEGARSNTRSRKSGWSPCTVKAPHCAHAWVRKSSGLMPVATRRGIGRNSNEIGVEKLDKLQRRPESATFRNRIVHRPAHLLIVYPYAGARVSPVLFKDRR